MLPLARELGVADLVTEQPGRLDYFEALRTLLDSSGILLLGSRERHYTPSKVFPALMSDRPIVAICHEASPAAELLRRVGRPPSIWLVTYCDESPASERVDAIAGVFADMGANPRFDETVLDRTAMEPSSAVQLAGRLARVLDRVATRKG